MDDLFFSGTSIKINVLFCGVTAPTVCCYVSRHPTFASGDRGGSRLDGKTGKSALILYLTKMEKKCQVKFYEKKRENEQFLI